MGKKSKLRDVRRHHAERIFRAVLEEHSKNYVRPRPAERYSDFRGYSVEALRAQAIRAPEDWRCRIKSRSEEKRFLDLVRFTFARYPVGAHLEGVWIEPFDDDFVDRIVPLACGRGRASAGPDLRNWYVIVAQGGSLHRQAAHPWLSKVETHHFLNPPPGTDSARSAFWYAFARAQSDDAAVSRDIAMTKLGQFSVASTFWKEAARFFARNPCPVAEMDDLIDYLYAAKQQDDRLSLKGRTLPALRRRMDEWHRALRKSQAIGGGAWSGRAIPDADYEAGSEHKKAIWRFRQIKTGNELFREGERMHHCVAAYKDLCLRGEVSIWTLSCEFPLGHINRGITIELRNDGAIVQCRGFANRLPYANEVAVVKRWVQQHGLKWQALER